ncbi:Dynein light chain 2, cytoplasmic [Glycine soja]
MFDIKNSGPLAKLGSKYSLECVLQLQAHVAFIKPHPPATITFPKTQHHQNLNSENQREREREMSEEAKKNFAGALTARPNSDEPKPAPVPAVPPKKVIIKSADMIPDMQKEAVDIAVAAFEKYNVEKDVAEQIKKEFDKRHGPTWHCIVGRSYVTHETNHFVYFYLDQKAVLLFKSG